MKKFFYFGYAINYLQKGITLSLLILLNLTAYSNPAENPERKAGGNFLSGKPAFPFFDPYLKNNPPEEASHAARTIACIYRLSATGGRMPATESTDLTRGSFTVTATGTGCVSSISVTSNKEWLNASSQQRSATSWLVNYYCGPNPGTTERSGTLIVLGQTYTVTQEGAATSCTYQVVPATFNVGAGQGQGNFEITTSRTGCTWRAEALPDASWIHNADRTGTSSNTSTVIHYTYEANPTSVVRRGTITVEDKTYILTQAGAECLITLPANPTVNVPANSGRGTIAVNANPADCVWRPTVAQNARWLTISNPQTFIKGPRNLWYFYHPNPTSGQRTGTITIAGQTYTVIQAGLICRVSLPAITTANVPATAGERTVSVAANATDCTWTAAVATNATWITLNEGHTFTGSKNLRYSFQANPTSGHRTGTITIAGQNYRVRQEGVICEVSLPITTATVPATAGNRTLAVDATGSDCTWTVEVSDTSPWLTITTGQTFTGSKALGYTYAANTTSVVRTGTISISGHDYTITQEGVACLVTLPSIPTANVPATAGNSTLEVGATRSDCTWTAVVSDTSPWLTITGVQPFTGPQALGYTYAANTTSVVRTGTISISGHDYTITQAGVACLVTLPSIPTANVPATAGNSTLEVGATRSDCTWTAVVSDTSPWLTITGVQPFTGPQALGYTYAANTTSVVRTGTISIDGRPYTITQAGVICSVSLPAITIVGVPATVGNATVAVTATGSDCTWTVEVSDTSPWLTITPSQTFTGSQALGYTYAANPTSVERIGTLSIDGKTYTITQSGVVCSVSLPAIPTATVPATAGNRTLAVGATGSDCPWTVVVSDTSPWLTITTGQTFTGSQALGYTYAANPTSVERTGTISISGQPYTITQSGVICSVSLPSIPTATVPATAGDTTVVVTANGSDCPWTAVVPTWITIPDGLTFMGSKNLGYTYQANPSSAPRTGVITIAGHPYTVTQAGVTCLVSLPSIPTDTVPATAGNRTLAVGATGSDCPWTVEVSDTSPWLTITPGQQPFTGSKALGYTYAANPTSVERTGTISIDGRPYTITQAGVICSVTLPSIPTANVPATAGNSTLEVGATRSDCTWTAVVSDTSPWLTITGVQPFTGPQALGYTYAANTTSVVRTGTISISGHDYTITQAGVACLVTLPSIPTATVPATAGDTTVAVTANGANCTWTAVVSLQATWIRLAPDQTFTGTKNLRYLYDANPTSVARIGTLTISGQPYTITQEGVICEVTLPAITTATVPATAGNRTVVVTATGSDCPWTAVAAQNAGWLSTTPGTLTGSVDLSYSYQANPTSVSRTGTISISGHDYTITQAGVVCLVTLPSNLTTGVPATAGEGTVAISATGTDCTWTATESLQATWIRFVPGQTFTGTKNLRYLYEANPTSVVRTGTLTIDGRPYTITQAGVICSVSLPAITIVGMPATAGNATVAVTATGSDCPWTVEVSDTSPWLTITPGQTFTGSQALGYTYAANTTSGQRTGTMTIDGKTYTVIQAGAACSYSLTPNEGNIGAAASTAETRGVVLVNGNGEGCSWIPVPTVDWISNVTKSSTATDGDEEDWTVSYSYTANPTTSVRRGGIILGDKTHTVIQAGAACAITLPSIPTATVPATAGDTTVAVTANGSDCPWTAVVPAWITIPDGHTFTGSKNLSYTYQANPTSVQRTGTITIDGHDYTVIQAGVICSVTLPSIPTATVPATAGDTTVVVTANGSDCPWTAVVPAWITIPDGYTFTGSKNLSYTYQVNPTSVQRTGTITIDGHDYTVIQAGVICSVSLPLIPTATVPATAGDTTVVVTANGSDCPWTAVVPTWITIPDGLTFMGSKNLGYTYQANPTSVQRTGTITIAGHDYTVIQAGVICSVSLPAIPTARVPSGAGNARVAVTANATDCPWSAFVPLNTDWITIPDGQNLTGSKNLRYSYPPNPSSVQRTGTITIADQIYTVIQAGAPCSYTATPTVANVGEAASTAQTTGIFSVAIQGNDCAWMPTTTYDWITPTKAATANANGSWTVTYSFTANTTTSGRRGTIKIDGKEAHTVIQAGTGEACFYTLTPEANIGAAASTAAARGVILVDVEGDACSWTPVPTVDWITAVTISTEANSEGVWTVSYSYTANTSTSGRSGDIIVADKIHKVIQAGIPCSITLPAITTAHVPAAAGDQMVAVTANGANCTWTAVVDTLTQATWLTITEEQTLTGSTDLSYSYAANPSSVARMGTILIAGHPYTVIQAGVICAVSLPAVTTANISGNAGHATVAVTANVTDCAWTVVVPQNASWITFAQGHTFTGSQNLRYSYAANPTPVQRTGIITIDGKAYTVRQAEAACSVSLPAITTAGVPATQGEYTVAVTTGTNCTWTVDVPTETWITIPPGQIREGTMNLSYACQANPTSAPRTESITIAGLTYTVIQAGVICSVSLPAIPTATVPATVGNRTVVVTANGSDCPWTAVVPAWITIPDGYTFTGSKNLSYTYQANPTSVQRTGTITIDGHDYTVLQAGVICAVSLPSIPTANVPATASEGTVAVTATGIDCTWEATVPLQTTWITLAPNQTSTGSKNLRYIYEANPTFVERTGHIIIDQKTYTVRQAGVICIASLPSIPTATVPATAGEATVAVTTNGDCNWSANVAQLSPWITIPVGQIMQGPVTLSYTYQANPTTAERTGHIIIDQKTYTVRQAGVICSVSIPSNPTATVPATAGEATVAVTANGTDCTWTAGVPQNAAWINIIEGPTFAGSQTLRYSYATNPTTVGRTGSITIDGRIYTVTQAGVICAVSLPAITTANVPATAGGTTVAVSANGTDCTWSAGVPVETPWLALNITSGPTLTGSQTLSYSYEANPTTAERTGTITIAGQPYTVVQAGVVCLVSLNENTTANVPATAGEGTVAVTASGSDCIWSATVSEESTWITIPTGQDLTGSNNLTYSYQANPTSVERTGTIAIAGQPYTVTQAGTMCLVSLSANTSATVPATAGEETVEITAAGSDCTWTAAVATNSSSWLTIISERQGTGSKTLRYSYRANPLSARRTGTIIIGVQIYTIIQVGVACSFSLSSNTAGVPTTAGKGTLNIVANATDCQWTATVNTEAASWLTMVEGENRGTGSKALHYSYSENPTSAARTGTLTVGNQTCTVTQAAGCSFRLSPKTANVTTSAGTGSVSVIATHNHCSWTAISNASWIRITTTQTLKGSKVFHYSYEANPYASGRIGTIAVAGQTHTVTQTGPCYYKLSSNTVDVPGAAGKGSIGVIASFTICSWSAKSNASWISIPSGQNLEGSKELKYSYAENPTDAPRTGTITVAGVTVTVTQTTLVTGMEPVSDLRIFPNPAKDFVTVDLSAKEIKCVSLQIANQIGEILYKVDNPPAQALQIPLTGFAGGLYFIFIQGEDKTWVKKLIVK